MAPPQAVAPVKLVVAVLWSTRDALEAALAALAQRWGPIDYAGADHPFQVTDYYTPEMGPGLQRRLIAFATLFESERLAEAKLACNRLEDELAGPHGRRVNLDLGYLDHNKIVLASLKYAGQKIHLGGGVYADLIARYRAGRYEPFEWSFPDFRDHRYDRELLAIRNIYREQLRAWRRQTTPTCPTAASDEAGLS